MTKRFDWSNFLINVIDNNFRCIFMDNKKIAMQIKYLGSIEQMDMNILLTNLLNISNVLEEINKSILPNKKIKINITAVEKGSFIVDIELFHQILNDIKDFFSNSEVQGIGIVSAAFIELLRLKKETKGKKPESIVYKDNEAIINGNVTVNKNTYNIYSKNEKINSSIQNTFEAIADEPNIEAFEVKQIDNKIPNFIINRNEFNIMQASNELLKEKEKTIEENNVELQIFKVVFESGRKWEFIYGGFKISAKIQDELFLRKVTSGEERFGKGDILKANIRITQIFDEEAGVYLNKEFFIMKIIDHIKPPEQVKLF
jgi:hypothetical protein